MTFDNQITLIGAVKYTSDAVGNQIATSANTNVLCSIKSVSSSEFYKAALEGLKPEMVFIVHPYEYNNEDEIQFDTDKYRVVRTYKKNMEELELTCEKAGI